MLLPAFGGCYTPPRQDHQQELTALREEVRQHKNQLVAQQATIQTLEQQLSVARSISEDDLKKLFFPVRLEFDKLTGGADYDDKPGDDGVTVYLRPIDSDGDVIKAAGDVRIQLYDLAAPASENLIGEYVVPIDKLGALWHGKLMTQHYTIKCPWRTPPEHTELTVRATFVDYLTKRVVSAQTTCEVELPPS